MGTIRIIPVTGETDLYCHYHGQTRQQPCYIELNPETDPPAVRADYDAEIGGAVPMSVWHGRLRRYRIPCLTASDAEALIEHLRPLLLRVAAGYTCHWDGSNHRGRLSEDARDAEEEIEREIDAWQGDEVVVWDAADYLQGGSPADIGLTIDTTDEGLDLIADDIYADARDNGVHIVVGLGDLLRSWRQDLRDACQRDADDE